MFVVYLLCGCIKFPLIFSLTGMVIGGFRWLRVVNKVRRFTEYGGKMLTLVKESSTARNSNPSSSARKIRTPFGVRIFLLQR